MKEQEKQIKEMAKEIGNTWLVDLEGNTKDVCEVLDEVDIKGIARELYEKGYRKLPEDSVVLSREKYNLLINIKKFFEIADSEISAGNLLVYLKEFKEEERKETAEKIYLQAKAIVDATKHIVQDREYIHIDALKEIIKNCGVEIKE